MTAALLTPTKKKLYRGAGIRFMDVSARNRLAWDYTKQRPYTGLGVAPEDEHEADCSSGIALIYADANHQTGIFVPDPLNHHYDRTGNTTSSIAFVKAHPAPHEKYLPLDLAYFGTNPEFPEHMSVCMKGGTTKTAVFWSNGHESWVFDRDAPELITLEHEKARQFLIGVYRHPSLL